MKFDEVTSDYYKTYFQLFNQQTTRLERFLIFEIIHIYVDATDK